MPPGRLRQPLTVDSDSQRPIATALVPPAASIIDPHVQVESSVMPAEIVRNSRTCQGFADCETTFRASHDEISTMDSDEKIGRRLIALRENHRKGQSEFAETLNIAKNTLNGYERGKRPLTLETAKRIRDRWGASLDWLLHGDIGQPGHELAAKLGPSPKISADEKKTSRSDEKKTPRKARRRT
jgi:transcriptional regulator with XRE-family HTH domain